VVLVLLGLLLGLAIPRLGAAANRAAVRSAADDLASTFAAARQHAIHRRGAVAVEIDTAAGCVSVRSGEESLARRDLRGMYSVRLAATRDSMAYDARGLGIGAANLSVVLRRGGAVETLFVSRLGRVRH
jgi:Tfp pilus assembly protein FimT